MEGIENQQTEVIEQPEISTEQIVEGSDVPTPTTEEPKQPEYNEAEVALSYLKNNGFEVENIDDLQRYKTPQIKEVNPYEDILDEEDRKYLEFKKTTGKSKSDYDMLRIDPETITPLEYAIEKVRNESGFAMSKEEVLEYLESELGIEDFNELSPTEKIKLSMYGKSVKDQRVAMYNDLKNLSTSKPAPQEQPEIVTLENGQQVNKQAYDNFQIQRQQYLNANKESVNSVTNSEFKIMLDDKDGSQREVSFTYEYNDQDRHSMLSATNDTNKLLERYQTNEGFNHKQFNEDAFWLNQENRSKAISSILNKALAMNTEETLKGRGNVNFTQPPLPAQKMEGVVMTSLDDIFKR